MFKPNLLFCICLIIFLSCKDKNTGTSSESTEPKIEAAVQGTAYPGLPLEIRNKLLNDATSVDYNWHNLPFSLSMAPADGLKQNIEFISNEVPEIIPNTCKPVARKYYTVGGEPFIDVDVYLNGSCLFYVFLENQRPKYANKITPEGINFYHQVLNSNMPKK